MSQRVLAKTIVFSIVVILFLAVFGYGLYMGVYHYTSGPEFCSKCHYVKPYVYSWAESPHKNVNCLECHEPSGPLGKLHSKSRGLNYYLMDMAGNHPNYFIEAYYINESKCFACHTGDNAAYPDAVKIDRTGFDHLQSIKNDGKCVSCHRNTGHDTDIKIEEKIKYVLK